MNTKYYTSIEQSKKLLELGLNPESADMHYPDYLLPCWSLGALLEIMPDTILLDGQEAFYKLKRENAVWRVYYESNFNYREEHSLELVEAVYSMVCWLIEQKYINVNK